MGHNRRHAARACDRADLSVLLTAALPADAAEEPVPTTLTLVTEPAYADTETPATVQLATEGGPVAAASVTVERRVGGEWRELAVLTTDEEGRAVTPVRLRRDAADNVLRASYAGDEVHAPSSTGRVYAGMRRREGVVRIDAPGSVVDEERVVIRIRRTTRTGVPVPGRVELWRRLPGEDWKRFRRPSPGSKGVARVQVTPRTDTRWRARAQKLDWVTGDRSRVHRIDNLPPGVPVALPAGAPRPRVDLPDQPRAAGEGPNPRISRTLPQLRRLGAELLVGGTFSPPGGVALPQPRGGAGDGPLRPAVDLRHQRCPPLRRPGRQRPDHPGAAPGL